MRSLTLVGWLVQAVVAEAVRRFGGKVTLIDTTSDLPNLKRQPGLLTWGVRDTKAETERWYASPSEVHDLLMRLSGLGAAHWEASFACQVLNDKPP